MPPPPKAGEVPRLSANVSNADLQTCQPWGMNITGGVPPYSVQIIADDSPLYTNTTAPSVSTDRFTYINRADPGRTMIGELQNPVSHLDHLPRSQRKYAIGDTI